jgi:hypothetical protein
MPGELSALVASGAAEDVQGFLRRAIGYFVDPKTRWDTPYLGGGTYGPCASGCGGSSRSPRPIDVAAGAHRRPRRREQRAPRASGPGSPASRTSSRTSEGSTSSTWWTAGPSSASSTSRPTTLSTRTSKRAAWTSCGRSWRRASAPARRLAGGPNESVAARLFPSLDQKFVLTSQRSEFKLATRTVSFAPASSSYGCTVPTHDRRARLSRRQVHAPVSGERSRR